MEADEEGWEGASRRLPRNTGMDRQRNTLPKARQRKGAPDPSVWSPDARMSSGDRSQTFHRGGGRGRGCQGDGGYRGQGSLPRGRGRGRGGSRGGYDSQERVNTNRAPSQRRINSMSLKRKEAAEKTKSATMYSSGYSIERSYSMPREEDPSVTTVSQPNLAVSTTPWVPGGRCPSFADMLKKSMPSLPSLEDVGKESSPNQKREETQQQRNTLPKVKQRDVVKQREVANQEQVEKPRAKEEQRIQMEVKIDRVEREEAEPSIDIGTSQSTWVPEGFGHVPIQIVEREIRETIKETTTTTEHFEETLDNSLTLFSRSESSVKAETVHVASEPRRSATVASVAQPEQEKRLLEGVSEQAKNTQKHETDAPADDSISSIRFHQIKSYANILSSGAHKLREGFKPKPAVESKENVAPQVIEFVHPALKAEEADPVPKPEIPGLVFKSSLSRRSSKKKKSIRSPSEECNREKENQSPEKEQNDKSRSNAWVI